MSELSGINKYADDANRFAQNLSGEIKKTAIWKFGKESIARVVTTTTPHLEKINEKIQVVLASIESFKSQANDYYKENIKNHPSITNLTLKIPERNTKNIGNTATGKEYELFPATVSVSTPAVKPKEDNRDYPRINQDNPKFPRLEINAKTSVTYNTLTKEYTYITEAPPIKNVVISGGGAKGVILPGVFKAFEENKVEGISFRDQLENIAGSSVGAMTAALVAAGLPADDLIEALSNEDFMKLLGNNEVSIPLPNGKNFTFNLPIHKDGKPLMDFLKTNMEKSIITNLLKLSGETDISNLNAKDLIGNKYDHDPVKKAQITDKINEVLKLINSKEADKPGLTFSMLQALHELDPKSFKNLTVTGTCCDTGTTYYFDAEKTPNLDIVVACRASASLPPVLKPVQISQKDLEPGYKPIKNGKPYLTFIDGGCYDNLPVNTLTNKQGTDATNKGEKGQNLQTLVLSFEGKERTEDEQSPLLEHKVDPNTLYDSTRFSEKLIKDKLATILYSVNTTKRITKTKKEGLVDIQQNYTQRNIPLNLPDIKPTSFKEAKEKEQFYLDKGHTVAHEYLRNHPIDELIYRTSNNLDDFLNEAGEAPETSSALNAFREIIEK